MSEPLRQYVVDVAMHPKTAASVSSGTVAAWMSDLFSLVPWGDVAGACGALLSLVLIVLHVMRYRRESKHLDLEDKLLKKKLKKG